MVDAETLEALREALKRGPVVGFRLVCGRVEFTVAELVECSGGGREVCKRAVIQPDFPTRVANELVKARAKHPSFPTLHHAYAVILEEVDEVWSEVKAQQWDRARIVKELAQVGAMVQRAAEDLRLIDEVTR